MDCAHNCMQIEGTNEGSPKTRMNAEDYGVMGTRYGLERKWRATYVGPKFQRQLLMQSFYSWPTKDDAVNECIR